MSLEITQELIARQTPQARKIIHSLQDTIQRMERRLDQLEKQNAKHLKRIAELEDRLKMTPQNSSLPPSAVHPHAKPASTKFQPKSKKKRGGQKGHKKHKRELVPLDQVNRIIPLKPSACRRCGEKLIGEDSNPIRHQVFELPEIKPLIIEYQRHRLVCPGCGESTCATLPEGVPQHQSGPRLSAFVSLLMAHYRQSKRRTALFLESVLNIPCSTGLVVKLQNRATQSLRPIYDQLVSQLPTQSVLGIDETPMKQANSKSWLWAFVAKQFSVFQIRPTRGSGILEDLLTDKFAGIVTCDRAKMYWKLNQLQWCWAHLKRDFQKMADNSNSFVKELGEKLLKQTRILFRQYSRCRDGTISRQGLKVSLGKVRKKIESLLLRGLKCDDTKTSGTCRELYWYRERLWRFLDHAGVEPTNNASERALRHPVIWRKLSLGTQSEKGSRFVETMLTIIETCRQQNRNVFEYVTESMTNTFANQPPPSLLPRV